MDFKVIVLCAGVGERLRPSTYTTNKSLLEINGKSLIQHWLDALIYSEAKVDAVHIVIGHYAYLFRQLLGSEYKGLKIRFLENTLYNITGAAQSLYTAYPILLNNPCIVLEGDHYMHPDLMKKLVESEFENCLLVDFDKTRLKYDEEVLAYGEFGLLSHLQWRPPYLDNPLGEALTVFTLSKKASNALAIILEHYLLELGPAKKEIVEPFNRLLASLVDIHYLDTLNLPWIEVDTASDLKYAEELKFN